MSVVRLTKKCHPVAYCHRLSSQRTVHQLLWEVPGRYGEGRPRGLFYYNCTYRYSTWKRQSVQNGPDLKDFLIKTRPESLEEAQNELDGSNLVPYVTAEDVSGVGRKGMPFCCHHLNCSMQQEVVARLVQPCDNHVTTYTRSCKVM